MSPIFRHQVDGHRELFFGGSERCNEVEMRYLLAVAILSLIPTAAIAGGECKQDKKKFCQGLDKKELYNCLNQHLAELSATCKVRVEERGKAKDARAEQSRAKRAAKEGSIHLMPKYWRH